ncbi:MAG: hypothetical protein HQ594_01795, partial [Candidatus Omnitrophica bacterium]|nr:hypothetical protein [Candidatus Omnitrophota bacterium]
MINQFAQSYALKVIAILVLCLFLGTDLFGSAELWADAGDAATLVPTLRSDPLVTVEWDESRKEYDLAPGAELKKTFREHTPSIYLTLSIGKFLYEQYYLKKRDLVPGDRYLAGRFEKFKEAINQQDTSGAVDLARYRYGRDCERELQLKLSYDTVWLPYEHRETDSTYLLCFYLLDRPEVGLDKMNFPMEDTGLTLVCEQLGPFSNEELASGEQSFAVATSPEELIKFFLGDESSKVSQGDESGWGKTLNARTALALYRHLHAGEFSEARRKMHFLWFMSNVLVHTLGIDSDDTVNGKLQDIFVEGVAERLSGVEEIDLSRWYELFESTDIQEKMYEIISEVTNTFDMAHFKDRSDKDVDTKLWADFMKKFGHIYDIAEAYKRMRRVREVLASGKKRKEAYVGEVVVDCENYLQRTISELLEDRAYVAYEIIIDMYLDMIKDPAIADFYEKRVVTYFMLSSAAALKYRLGKDEEVVDLANKVLRRMKKGTRHGEARDVRAKSQMLMMLGHAYIGLDMKKEALRVSFEGLKLCGPASTWEKLPHKAEGPYQLNKYDVAITLRRIANLYLGQVELEKAREYVELLLKVSAGGEKDIIYAANIFMSEILLWGKYLFSDADLMTMVVEHLEEASRHAPEDITETHIMASWLYCEGGDIEAAREELEKIKEFGKLQRYCVTAVRLYKRLAFLYRYSGDPETAKMMAKKAIDLAERPSGEDVEVSLGEVTETPGLYIITEGHEAAVRRADELLKRCENEDSRPWEAVVWFAKARVYINEAIAQGKEISFHKDDGTLEEYIQFLMNCLYTEDADGRALLIYTEYVWFPEEQKTALKKVLELILEADPFPHSIQIKYNVLYFLKKIHPPKQSPVKLIGYLEALLDELPKPKVTAPSGGSGKHSKKKKKKKQGKGRRHPLEKHIRQMTEELRKFYSPGERLARCKQFIERDDLPAARTEISFALAVLTGDTPRGTSEEIALLNEALLLFKEGDESYKKQDFQDALRKYESAIEVIGRSSVNLPEGITSLAEDIKVIQQAEERYLRKEDDEAIALARKHKGKIAEVLIERINDVQLAEAR